MRSILDAVMASVDKQVQEYDEGIRHVQSPQEKLVSLQNHLDELKAEKREIFERWKNREDVKWWNDCCYAGKTELRIAVFKHFYEDEYSFTVYSGNETIFQNTIRNEFDLEKVARYRLEIGRPLTTQDVEDVLGFSSYPLEE